jgi:glycerol-3-phosphate dehydrogenase
MYPALCRDLDVDFRQNGSMVLAFNEQEKQGLLRLMSRGERNGVEGLKLLEAEQILAMEPSVSPQLVAGLFAPTAGVVDPQGLVAAAWESAAANGVALFRGWRVDSLRVADGAITVSGRGREIRSQYVVNAAGAGAHRLAESAGDRLLPLETRRGEYHILDKVHGKMVTRTLFGVPGIYGKGILVAPAAHGNLLAGPTAENVTSERERATTAAGLQSAWEQAQRLVPGLPADGVIGTFAGVRAAAGDDFVLSQSEHVPGLLHLAGICSPGLTAAPALAEWVVQSLAEMGLTLSERDDWNPKRERIPSLRESGLETRSKLVAADPTYGRVVCRCELVSEAEIVAAIRRNPGALTLDGVKMRLRPGMGRCQGGFCAPVVMEILARELAMSVSDVEKDAPGSWVVTGRSDEGASDLGADVS